MGRYVLGNDGCYWWHDDPEEVRMEPYLPSRHRHDDMSWWQGDWNVHDSTVRPNRQLTDDEYQAIMSVLEGETKEEWVARRQAEGKPITPTGEEKQD